ncbi:YidC/Oxa1 family membrane protein insertase [Dehalococcoidales bacterium]|nr:YidC/Oxa1 family membrane protein insertase [Dehalococcoidales bacterium]
MGELWNLIIMQPVINVLIVLSHYLFGSFGLAIIALTIIVNGLMYPLTLKQIKVMKAMQALQSKLAELQKKYAKNKEKLAKEQVKLYKESGVSPAGCLLPLLIQLPIWIALFWSIMKLVAETPEDFLRLSQYLYPWAIVHTTVPLESKFLWLDLSRPDFLLAILVGGTMWLQQKMTMMPTADPKQQAMSRMMLWMMPLMFGFSCLLFDSGLALFWLISNVIRIGMQYQVTGWGGLVSPTAQINKKRRITKVEQAPSADIVDQKEELVYGGTGDKRQDSRGKSLSAIRHQPRRSHRRKRK